MKFIPYLLAATLAIAARADDVKLSAVVNVRNADNEHARPALDKTTRNHAMTIAGQEFKTGVGTEVNTRIAIDLKGAQKFSAKAGVDDASEGSPTVHFEIQADGEVQWQQDIKKGDAPVNVQLNTAGKKQLLLITRDIGNAYSLALANWA